MDLVLGTKMPLYYSYISEKQTNYKGGLLDSLFFFLINKTHGIILQEKENAVQNVVIFLRRMQIPSYSCYVV